MRYPFRLQLGYSGVTMSRMNPEWFNRPRKNNNPESRLQLQIIHYLKALGAVVGKTKTTGIRRGRAFCFDPYLFRGFPDLTLFYKNQLFFIEVKSEKGKQTYEQKNFETLCLQANIPYILAKTLENVSSVIK